MNFYLSSKFADAKFPLPSGERVRSKIPPEAGVRGMVNLSKMHAHFLLLY